MGVMLRWLLAVLLVALAGVSLTAGVSSARQVELREFRNAAVDVGTTFVVPVDDALLNPEVVSGALKRAAAATTSNVFRTSVGYDADGKQFTAHYAWLTTTTDFFDSFRLRSGHFLSIPDSHSGDRYVSTGYPRASGQTGVLESIGRTATVNIYGLDRAFAALPTAGNYVVECATEHDCDAFFSYLIRDFTNAGTDVSRASLVSNGTHITGGAIGASEREQWTFLALATATAVAILAAYQQLYESKRTAVLRLHGASTAMAWYRISGRLILTTSAISGVAVVGIAALIPGGTTALTARVAAGAVGVSVLALLACLATIPFIRAVRVHEALKNRKDTRLLSGLNVTVKLVTSVALVVLGTGALAAYADVRQTESRLHAWQSTSAYGIFQPVYNGNDLDELQTGGTATADAEAEKLYPALEKRGALFIDSTAFEDASLEQPVPDGAYRSLRVNPNYLAEYPVLAANGEPVRVNDDEPDWVVLVPETLRAHAADITTYFQSMRTGGDSDEGVAEVEKKMFGRAVPDAVAKQKVRIIWTASGQRVFAFNPSVASDDGGSVRDPIIEVMTAGNSVASDRVTAITGDAGGALKVRLAGNYTTQTLRELGPTLRSLHLDDNLRSLVTLDEYALEQLQEAQAGVRYELARLVIVFAVFLVLAVQAVTLLFEQDARRVAVRKLFGFGFVPRHRLFATVFAATWSAQFLIVGGIYVLVGARLALPAHGMLALACVGLAFLVTEAAVAAAAIAIVERRRVANVLKGEF